MTRGAQSAARLFAAAATVYLLDRVTKVMAVQALEGRPPIQVLPGVRLAFTTNPGGAFSIGGGAPWVFVGATIVVSTVIVLTAFRHTSLVTAVALGCVLGGALGNLTDRILRGPDLHGHVIDFIDVGPWPVFNVADSAIVVGALLLAWTGLRASRDEPAGESDGP
ncbi:MAG: signal peptidase II [Actinomycetota bacterium]